MNSTNLLRSDALKLRSLPNKYKAVAEAVGEISRITSKYGLWNCVETANDIKAMLISRGLKGQQIKLQNSQLYNIWSDIYNENISTNGFHTGILFEGKVYDNIHKMGISLEDWLADFHCPGELVKTFTNF